MSYWDGVLGQGKPMNIDYISELIKTHERCGGGTGGAGIISKPIPIPIIYVVGEKDKKD